LVRVTRRAPCKGALKARSVGARTHITKRRASQRWARLPPLGKDFSWPQMISGSRLTLFPECFSFVPRGTCALSVSRRCLTFNGTVTTGCWSHTLKWLDFALGEPRRRKTGTATRRSLSLALPFQAIFAAPLLHGNTPHFGAHTPLQARVQAQVVLWSLAATKRITVVFFSST